MSSAHTEDAVLLPDGGLQVIHASTAATALLDRGDGLVLRHRRLVARHPDDDGRLQAVLCPARPGSADRRRRISLSFAVPTVARFSSRLYGSLHPARTARFRGRVGWSGSAIPSTGVSPIPRSCKSCS